MPACFASSEEETSEDEAVSVQTRTVCFAGATLGPPRETGGISELETLCDRLPGLIRDVPGGPDASFGFFQWTTPISHVLDVLVKTLDTNRDGIVTNTDAPVNLLLVGYSWGGFNARDAADAIDGDQRFSPLRKVVHRLISLDAYKTDYAIFPRADLRVPKNVRFFESFRHSIAPADECSLLFYGLVGPFTGRVPYCTGTTVCKDYDFSKAAATAGVDHCDVPSASEDLVVSLALGTPLGATPPAIPVKRY